MPAPNLIIVPPASTRASSSKADSALVAAMAAQISPETWVSDGKTYKTYKAAQNASGLYRRALPKALNIEPHKMRSKTWGTDAKGVVVTDRDKEASWVFAFTTAPDRVKRTRAARS